MKNLILNFDFSYNLRVKGKDGIESRPGAGGGC